MKIYYRVGIIILLFIFVKNDLVAQTNTCGFTPAELEQFGPWICPDYVPSAGFPGSTNAAQLGEVVISRPHDNSNYMVPEFPVVVTLPNATYVYNTVPCPGDPIKNTSVAPSNGWNYKGGTFGYTRSNGAKFHDGVDLVAPIGTNVYAMHAGTITAIERSFAPQQYRENSYGNYISVKSVVNGVTVTLKYNHLQGVNGNLVVGGAVNQGAYIAVAGNTGNAKATGVIPHIHVQGKDANGNRIDPAPYIRTKFDTTTGKATNPCN